MDETISQKKEIVENKSSRDPSLLHRDLLPLYLAFVEECKSRGLCIYIVCTWRSPQDQLSRFNRGRTLPGDKITDHPAGSSPHNYTMLDGTPASLAFDILPIVKNKPVYKDYHRVDKALWTYLGEIGRTVGLEWNKNKRDEFRLPSWAMKIKQRRS